MVNRLHVTGTKHIQSNTSGIKLISISHQLHDKCPVVELVNTFGWGPVMLPIRGLQEEVLDVVWWRDTTGKATKHYEATSTQRHLPVQQIHMQTHFALSVTWHI